MENGDKTGRTRRGSKDRSRNPDDGGCGLGLDEDGRSKLKGMIQRYMRQKSVRYGGESKMGRERKW